MPPDPTTRAYQWVHDESLSPEAQALRLRAAEWVDRVNAATGLSGGWRLQVMSLRTRRDYRRRDTSSDSSETETLPPASDLLASDGSPVYAEKPLDRETDCPERPARIRRFVSGCPWPILDQVVRYLYATAPYQGIVFNGVRSEGVYRPTLTQWTRDAQTQVGADSTYTLIQDLIEVTECGDFDLYTTGSSCLSTEETEFHWDEPSVEPLEPLSCEESQGVTVSIQAVRRNDDGTFDYQKVTSHARTRHVAAHAVSCDAAHSVTEERWENLYGEPGGFRVSDDACGVTDQDLSGLPSANCSAVECGVHTSWEVQLNRDCTYSVSKRVVETNEQETPEWTDGTACRTTVHNEVKGTCSLPTFSAPGVGQRVDVRVQVDDDGTYSWARSVTTAPDEDSVTWDDGTPCRTRATAHYTDIRSKADAENLVPPRAVGKSVDAQISRNEDCTYDVRVVEVSAPAEETVEWDDGSNCRPRENRHVTNLVGDLSAAKQRIHGLQNGYSVDARIVHNDDCTWDVTSTKVKTAVAWDAEWTDGSKCRPRLNVRRTGLDSLDAAKGEIHLPEPGYTVQADVRMADDCSWEVSSSKTKTTAAWDVEWTDGSECRPRVNRRATGLESKDVARGLIHEREIGYTVQADVRMADDCSWEVSSSKAKTTTPDSVQWNDGSPCRPRTVRHVMGVASSSEAVDLVPGRQAGHTVDATVRRNDDCTWDVMYSDTDDTAAAMNESVEGGSQCRRRTWHFVQAAVEKPVIPEPGEGQTVAVTSYSKNADCTWSASWTVTDPSSADNPFTWTDGTTQHTTEHEAYSDVSEIPDFSGKVEDGVTVSAHFRRNDDCTYSGEVTTTTAAPNSSDPEWVDGSNCGGKTTTQVYSHVSEIVEPEIGDGRVVRASWRREEDGTYSGQVSTTVWDDIHNPVIATDWDTTEETPTHKYYYHCWMYAFRHASPELIENYISACEGSSLSVDIRMEDDCTMSGTVVARKLVRWEDYTDGSGGHEGGISGPVDKSRTRYLVIGGRLYYRTLNYKVTTYKGLGNLSASTAGHYDFLEAAAGGITRGINLENPDEEWRLVPD